MYLPLAFVLLCSTAHATATSGIWEEYENRYLAGYPEGVNEHNYHTLTAAQDACLAHASCGGVTLDRHGSFTIRAGSEPLSSPVNETSWVKPSANIFETNVQGSGSWGGSCTCPDGQVYQVGDLNGSACNNMVANCVGGTPGQCSRNNGPWSHNKVTCATNTDPERTAPVANKFETNVQGSGAWGGSCTCPDGQVYQVGDSDGSACSNMAANCIDGTPGQCTRSSGPWSHNKVTCSIAVLPQKEFKYVGCFVDDAERDLNEGPKQYGYNPTTCSAECRIYPYFALQNHGWCVCGNAFSSKGKYKKVADSECGADKLGGPWRNAVFEQTTLSADSQHPCSVCVAGDGYWCNNQCHTNPLECKPFDMDHISGRGFHAVCPTSWTKCDDCLAQSKYWCGNSEQCVTDPSTDCQDFLASAVFGAPFKPMCAGMKPLCETSQEHAHDDAVHLDCGNGRVVDRIVFASYGLPTGTCEHFTKSSTCASSTSVSVVEERCLGRETCSVPARNSLFGDPCVGTVKKLTVQATCGPPKPVCSTAPSGDSAHLDCGEGFTIGAVTFASYGKPTGTCGQFAKAPACHASTSLSVVKEACLGSQSCDVPATDKTFGSPCAGTHELAVQVTCAALPCGGCPVGQICSTGTGQCTDV